MKKLTLLLIGILLYSCGPSYEEIEYKKQLYNQTVTHVYEITLESGQTFTTNVCTRMNDQGEDYIYFSGYRLENFWGKQIAKGVTDYRKIEQESSPLIDGLEMESNSHYTNGLTIILPEKYKEISRDKTFKESLNGYISGDTLYIEFNH